jgi:hypothetical protein
MIFGMSTATFTTVHVIISLLGIASGFVVLYGLLNGKALRGWTGFFLATTVATSVTGFGFPIHKVGPPHIVGVISLLVLAVALAALYAFHLAGSWRPIYVITAAIALYLNVFVGVVQSFQKVAPLHALAPLGSEPIVLITQVVVLALFVYATIRATKRFRVAPLAA